MRRYLIIIAIAIVVIGLGAFAYFYFFANSAKLSVAPPGSSLPTAGNTPAGDTGAPVTATSSESTSGTTVTPRLVKINAGPVVPATAALDVPGNGTTTPPDTVAKYIDRQSGNIYSFSVASDQSTRTSNRTVPGIENAYWLPSGATAFVEYLSGAGDATVNTYALDANGASGFFLPQDLAGVAVSSTSVLTLASGVNGSSVMHYNADGSHPTELFTTPLSMVRIGAAGKSTLLYTKPAESQDGYAYLVDAKGFSTRIAGPLPGLVALSSPDGKWALVSSSSKGVMQLALVNTTTGELTALPVATIADKCVWAADGSAAYCGVPQTPSASYAYPDDWYQGAASFSDRIWKIDVTGRFAQLVLDFPTETKQILDAEALSIDPAGKLLVFVNKRDGSVWAYQL